MRRLTSTLASFALVAAGLVALAGNSPASAAATAAVTLASGDSALPDLQTLLTANENGYVYETLNAANQPTLWAQKLNDGAADGAPVKLTGSGWTNLTGNGLRPGLNLSIAGSMIAAAGTPFSSFGTEQQRLGTYNLATGTPTNPIISGSSDGDGGFGGFNQVFFAGPAPDGFLFVKFVPASGETPASISVVDETQARDTKVDLGQLPDASDDPTLLAGITTATSPTGTVIAYPTTLGDENNPKDNLVLVPYNGDPFTVLATQPSGTFDSSLMTGGGNVAWANYLLGFDGTGCKYFTLPLDGSGNGTPTMYTSNGFCDTLGGLTDTKMVLAPFPIFAGQGSGAGACPATIQTCPSGVPATINLLNGAVTKSTTDKALSAATDGTNLYYSQGTTLGTAGIYSGLNVTTAGTLFAAASAKPLAATSVSAAPGQVSWTDDSTTSYPVQSRTVSNNGTTLDLGTPQTIAGTSLPLTADDGYGNSTSGKRTAYAAPPASGNLNRLLVDGPGGTQVVTNYTDGTPSMNFRDPEPATVQVSGSNVLYLTDDADTGYDGHVYNTVTHQTRNFPQAAAYALSGGYLAWLGLDGSVSRQDIVANTAAVVLRPATTLTGDQTVDITGQVAVAGDYVSWLVRECITTPDDFTCLGNTEAGYRNAATMADATTFITTPTTAADGTTPLTPLNIAMSADYLVVEELNPAFNPNAHALVAVKLSDNSTSSVASNNSFVSGAGKFAVDGSTVAWIDATGAPMAKGLDSNVDVPRTLTVDAPTTLAIGTAAPFELVASTGFFNCQLTIKNALDATVRTIDCTDVNTDGDVIVNWDGTDDAAQALPTGTYTWTLNVASAGGNLQDYTGVEGPATGTVDLVTPTNTLVVWPDSITYGQEFLLDVTVSSDVTTPTGSVTLKDGDTVLDTQPLVNGQATFDVSGTALTPGAHTLTVVYNGTEGFGDSSASQGFTVLKATSTLSATYPAKPVYGKAWTVKVTVGADGVTPTGTVTLKNGSTTLASHTLSAGKATLTVPGTKLKPGKHTLTLRYGGSSTVLSKSSTKTLTVQKATSTVHNTLNVTHISRTGHAKLTVTVSATGGVVRTGTIKVFSGTKQIAKVQLTAAKHGKVVVTLPTMSVGKHQIHATYSGSPTVKPGRAAPVTLTVTKS